MTNSPTDRSARPAVPVPQSPGFRLTPAPGRPKASGGASAFIGFLILLGLSFCPEILEAREFNPAGWPQPDLFGAARYYDDSYDFDVDFPGPETRLEKFRTAKGGRVFRYSYNGNTYCFAVDHDTRYPLDFIIVDFDGDGVFEIKQSPYYRFRLPAWTYQD